MSRPELKRKRITKWKEVIFEPYDRDEIICVPVDRHKLDSRQIKAANERWKNVTHCMTCGRPFGRKRPQIDHCHVTGVIRGKICYRCNIAIGLMRDDVYIVKSIFRHLEYFSYNPDMVEQDMWADNLADRIKDGFE